MLWPSKLIRTVIFCLCCFSVSTWAEDTVSPAPVSQVNACHFYKLIKDSSTLSDPANQVSAFMRNNWPALENDLAHGDGEVLSYVRKLTLCPYTLQKNLWADKLKNKPYDQRQVIFSELFFSKCFCNW